MMLLSEANIRSSLAQFALDEWLWQRRENEQIGVDLLRIWEPSSYAIVLGRGSKADIELNRRAIERDGVTVVRRITGGAAIVCGPGCLMYSLVVDLASNSELHQIGTTHATVLGRIAESLAHYDCHVHRAGTSDLVRSDDAELRKCSGNSMRLGRRSVLYHGTLLYAMDLSVVSQWLNHPSREPAYRKRRSHEAFLANLPLAQEPLMQAVIDAFGAVGTFPAPDERELTSLLADRYADDSWSYCL